MVPFVPHVAVKVPEPQYDALKFVVLPSTTGVAGMGSTVILTGVDAAAGHTPLVATACTYNTEAPFRLEVQMPGFAPVPLPGFHEPDHPPELVEFHWY